MLFRSGPKEAHIVLLDNNRSKMLKDKYFYKALSCIRCGACMNHCPVYDKIGGHAYMTTYPGPIGEVVSPQLFGLDNCGYVLNLCSLCGKCSEVCPVKIPLDELIIELRREKVGQGEGHVKGFDKTHKNKVEASIMKGFANVATNGAVWHTGVKIASNFNGVLKAMQGVMPIVNQWSKYKELPQIKSDLHDRIKKIEGVTYG